MPESDAASDVTAAQPIRVSCRYPPGSSAFPSCRSIWNSFQRVSLSGQRQTSLAFVTACDTGMNSQRLSIEDAMTDLMVMTIYVEELRRRRDPNYTRLARRAETMSVLIEEARSLNQNEVDLPTDRLS